MLQPGRKFSAGSGYRYGFNGKENDKDVKGDGNQQDYGMRIYDPRIGKFLSVDPLTKGFPWYTPYQFAGNTPIQAIDLDGEEEKHYTLTLNKNGSGTLTNIPSKTKEFNEIPLWLRIITLGAGKSKYKIPSRAVITYGSNTYKIGYASSPGNDNGMDAFNKILQNPNNVDVQNFTSTFLNENQSSSVAWFTWAVNMQNSTAMYGPLTTKAWYTALDETHNFKTPLSSRHLATNINQKTLAKETNTVALPSVNLEADAAVINSGNAAKVGDQYYVNGRFYGQHDGTLYPISGTGLYKLDRGAFKALGVLNEFGDTEKAATILSNMKMTFQAISSARDVYNQIKPKTK